MKEARYLYVITYTTHKRLIRTPTKKPINTYDKSAYQKRDCPLLSLNLRVGALSHIILR